MLPADLDLDAVLPSILLALMALGVGGVSLRKLLQARAYPGWPGAEARVLAASVEERLERRQGRERRRYQAVVVYEYEVEGRRYRSSGIALGYLPSPRRGCAEAIAARHPAGAGRPVRHRPGHPEEAYLEPPRAGGFVFGVLFAACVLGVAFWLWPGSGAPPASH